MFLSRSVAYGSVNIACIGLLKANQEVATRRFARFDEPCPLPFDNQELAVIGMLGKVNLQNRPQLRIFFPDPFTAQQSVLTLRLKADGNRAAVQMGKPARRGTIDPH